MCDDTTIRVDSSNYAARPAAIGSKATVRLYSALPLVARALSVSLEELLEGKPATRAKRGPAPKWESGRFFIESLAKSLSETMMGKRCGN